MPVAIFFPLVRFFSWTAPWGEESRGEERECGFTPFLWSMFYEILEAPPTVELS